MKTLLTGTLLLSILGGCSVQGSTISEPNTKPITFGTFECCEVLDPANTYSSTDWPFMQQIYSSILNVDPLTGDIVPELAESAGFESPTRYRVVMRENLSFSNGNPLTASDAVHSLKRTIEIDSGSGPQILLANVLSIELVDDRTFDLELLIENDATVEHILSSMVGLVVDEEIFPADRVLTNQEVLESNAFSGPYLLSGFSDASLMSFVPNAQYKGVWGSPKNQGVVVRAYQDSNNLISALRTGEIDLAIGYRSSLLPQLVELGSEPGFELIAGPTTEASYLWLSHLNLPFGLSDSRQDDEKSKDFRQVIASLIDRKEVSEYAYFGKYLEMPTAIPMDLRYSTGSDFLQDFSQDFEARQLEAARSLEEMGLETPVPLTLLTSESRWGDLSIRLSTIVREQLERSGLFEIKIETLEWSAFRERRKEGSFELSLQMWGNDFADADNYLTPLVTTDSWIANGYSSEVTDDLVRRQARASTPEERALILSNLQDLLRQDLPFVPLVSGGPVLVAREGLSGLENFVDSNWKLIFPLLAN